MIASQKGFTDIAKLLLEQKGINFNAKDICLISLMFL